MIIEMCPPPGTAGPAVQSFSLSGLSRLKATALLTGSLVLVTAYSIKSQCLVPDTIENPSTTRTEDGLRLKSD